MHNLTHLTAPWQCKPSWTIKFPGKLVYNHATFGFENIERSRKLIHKISLKCALLLALDESNDTVWRFVKWLHTVTVGLTIFVLLYGISKMFTLGKNFIEKYAYNAGYCSNAHDSPRPRIFLSHSGNQFSSDKLKMCNTVIKISAYINIQTMQWIT